MCQSLKGSSSVLSWFYFNYSSLYQFSIGYWSTHQFYIHSLSIHQHFIFLIFLLVPHHFFFALFSALHLLFNVSLLVLFWFFISLQVQDWAQRFLALYTLNSIIILYFSVSAFLSFLQFNTSGVVLAFRHWRHRCSVTRSGALVVQARHPNAANSKAI